MMVSPKLLAVLFMVWFDGTQGWLIKPSDIPVDFWLYTKNNKIHKETILTTYLGNNFISGARTIFLIHGFTDKGSETWIQNMKGELLTLPESLNVVIVNWQEGASKAYSQSAQNTRTVGEKTGDLIKAIADNKGVAYSNFHIIGHSLGAHCAGFAGKRVIELASDKIGRISGLDPAGYKFANSDASERLANTDADFVDVMHTNDGVLLSLSFGYKKGETIGDVDFYPNGGAHQPGCLLKIACSHGRAVDYFTSSINTCQYKTHRCPDGVVIPSARMGYHTSTSLRGTYCLETEKEAPYCEK